MVSSGEVVCSGKGWVSNVGKSTGGSSLQRERWPDRVVVYDGVVGDLYWCMWMEPGGDT
jgi:hypothetical protein